MILQKTKWQVCKNCGRNEKIEQEEIQGCDNCKKVIDFNKATQDSLRVQVFTKTGGVTVYHFCSWKCVLNKTKSLKSDDFIILPFLSFDMKYKGCTVEDFFKAIRDFK